jgi:hypothetical protein
VGLVEALGYPPRVLAASYASAGVVCLVAAAVGLALYRLLRIPAAWSAPAVGLAVLVVLQPLAIELPGHGLTAGAILVLVALASAPLALGGATRDRLVDVLPVALAAAAACAIPFVANWRFGVLGGSFNSDLGPHMAWADALRRGDETVAIIPGYPVGAHGLVGSLGALFGSDALVPFTGLLIALPVLTAVTAWGALSDLMPVRRFFAAGVVALPFLVAGQYGQQAAFKELLMALFVLASTMTFLEWRRDGDPRPRRAIPFGVIVGGAISVYGEPAAYYAVALVGAWAATEFVMGGTGVWMRIRMLVAATGVAALTAALSVAPQLGRLREFSATDVAGEGNVPDYVSRLAVFGVWPTADFRFPPPDTATRWAIGVFVIGIVLYATFWWLSRRELLVPAVTLAAIALHTASELRGTPYIAAKTLAIASPMVMLLCARALLADGATHRHPRLAALAAGPVATIFLFGALWSTGAVLRNGVVGATDRSRDLAGLREIVAGEPTLFLGQSYFAMWELQGARLSTHLLYAIPSQVPFVPREGKPIGPGAATDFDSVEPRSLDSFRYVVTPLTTFASVPPPNWMRVRTTRNYVLWARDGPTPPREILDYEGQFPGARLDCAGGRNPDRTADAVVRPEPILGGPNAWTTAAGAPALPDPLGYSAVAPGTSIRQTLRLRRGRWELAFQYASSRPLDVIVGIGSNRIKATLAPALEPRGDFWRIAVVDLASTEEATVSVTPTPPPLPLADMGRHSASLGTLAATRIGGAPSHMPLGEACGRYVDAYTPR